MVSRLQGSYITKHEGKSKVRDADSHFLFPGICSDYIFINLDRCMNLLLFTGKLVPYGLFFRQDGRCSSVQFQYDQINRNTGL